MPEKNNPGTDTTHLASPERRSLLKKAAYTAPALIVLGTVIPIKKAYAYSPPIDPTPPAYLDQDELNR